MPLVTVPAHDERIVYSGSSWKDDLFEIRPGIDPPTGGGVNASGGEVCRLGVKSRETWGFGNGFAFSFTGVAVRLVMESRQDHGIYTISVDGRPTATLTGYSDAPHCGAPFVADGLALGEHTVSATLTARDPASTWDDSYMQFFAVQYDPGSSSNSTSQGPQSAVGNGGAAPTTPVVVSSQKTFSTGAIAGVTAGAFVLTFALSVLAFWLFRRHRHHRGCFIAVPKHDAEYEYDGSEKPVPMRRGKGRRQSVLSAGAGELSPYTLHHQSASPAASPGSDLSATSTNTPARTPPPGLGQRTESPSYITAYALSPPPPPILGAAPKSRPKFDAGFSDRRPSHEEDGGTMLPPYTRSSH